MDWEHFLRWSKKKSTGVFFLESVSGEWAAHNLFLNTSFSNTMTWISSILCYCNLELLLLRRWVKCRHTVFLPIQYCISLQHLTVEHSNKNESFVAGKYFCQPEYAAAGTRNNTHHYLFNSYQISTTLWTLV